MFKKTSLQKILAKQLPTDHGSTFQRVIVFNYTRYGIFSAHPALLQQDVSAV